MSWEKGHIEDALRIGFLGGGALRQEDQKKARELLPLLREVDRLVPRARGRGKGPFVLVDACAGKAALAVLAAHFVLRARPSPAHVITLERDPASAARATAAARLLDVPAHVTLEACTADVDDDSAWPVAPDLVLALHACGAASDSVIARAIAAGARALLLVPCCYGAASSRGHDGAATRVPSQRLADAWSETMGFPRHALVQRRLAQAVTDAARTLTLEAAGYQCDVVEFVPPTVTPFCLLWRARLVREPVRMQDAAARLRLLST